MFHYDAATHTYTLGGKKILGLTETLHSVAMYQYLDNVKDDVAEWARERGQGAHLATLFHDRGTLDESSVHPDVRPFLNAWIEFKKMNPFKMLHYETPIYSKTFRFGCTPDRIVQAGAVGGVLEIKASAYKSPTYRIQTVGQAIAASEFYGMNIRRRFVVMLSRDGKYKIEEYKLTEFAQDRDVFLSALRLSYFKREKKI